MSLSAILSNRDDLSFVSELVTWLDAPKGKPSLGFDRQPPVGRMLWVLAALAMSVESDGMTHFLLSAGVGEHFLEVPNWARTIGASETAHYGEQAVARLASLNGGTLPSMEDAERRAAIRRLEREDAAEGGEGLFEGLDEEYRDVVVEELPARLRAFVASNADEIQRVLMQAAEEARSA